MEAPVEPTESVDLAKARYAFIIGLVGVIGVILVILVLVWVDFGSTSSDIVGVVGTITGLVGTVVGAFLGVQAGSEGRQAIEKQLNKTRETLERAYKLEKQS